MEAKIMGSSIEPKKKLTIDRKDTGGDPVLVVEGMEDLIEKDLKKHQIILARTKIERQAYAEARSHEIKKKKHYRSLIGGGKFSDDALRKAMDQIAVNIGHMSNKVKLSDDKIAHETLIVDTLTKNLENQRNNLKILSEHRKKELDAANNRLGK